MSMTAAFTRADYERLPYKFPAQLIEGLLVKDASPSYGHANVGGALFVQLSALVGHARCPLTPLDVLIDDENIYVPDLVVLRVPPAMDAQYVGVPLLVVEVLSPSTARWDRRQKKDGYLRAGVAEVWIVDPKAQSVEVHDANGLRTTHGDETARSAALPGFDVTPSVLFAPPR